MPPNDLPRSHCGYGIRLIEPSPETLATPCSHLGCCLIRGTFFFSVYGFVCFSAEYKQLKPNFIEHPDVLLGNNAQNSVSAKG